MNDQFKTGQNYKYMKWAALNLNRPFLEPMRFGCPPVNSVRLPENNNSGEGLEATSPPPPAPRPTSYAFFR